MCIFTAAISKRPARLSASESIESEYEEIESLLSSSKKDPLTRAKKAVYRLVKKVGFFGILLCASVSVDVSSWQLANKANWLTDFLDS